MSVGATIPGDSCRARLAGLGLVFALITGCADGTVDPSAPSDGAEVPAEDDLAEKPTVDALLPSDRGAPPAELIVEDVVTGDGEVAEPGDTLQVHYVGVLWESGRQFDASWDRGRPFLFTLGDGRVIAGWERGLTGMRVHGRRMLIVPPDLAYGERGVSGSIGPDETLVFVVDLLDVESGP
ncbi:MAG: FKBP-type peptidyl-prolyl cis-trans isomerase [Nitriliruptoraceae bacterium]